jgi:poly(3-hydroxybutyrate) depolymerase
MKPLRLAASLACIFLFIQTSFAKETLKKSTFTFAGKTRTYYSFVPDDPKPLPVVVLLHGSGRNGTEMGNAWKGLAASEHFIIVAPDSLDTANWDSQQDPPQFLHAVVDDVKATHPIDPTRIYLFGNSGGGVYALALALLDSDYYAAVAAHAAAMSPDMYPLFAHATRKMPIDIWVGDRDNEVDLDTARKTEAEFKSHGYQVKLAILINHSHDYSEVAGQIDHIAWKMFSSAPPTAPPAAAEAH